MLLTELSTDKLKSEEELERLINDKVLTIYSKTELIKETLKQIVSLDLMIDKWRQYTMSNDVVDNNNK
jgi:hypothetical protein